MDYSHSRDDELFREEVKDFLSDKLTDDLKRRAQSVGWRTFTEHSLAMEWQTILHEQGWVAPAWPKEHGGTGWSVVQRFIYQQECLAAGTPHLYPQGIMMLGPTLIGHGTEEQQNSILPRILSGEDLWCQGYSEPGSGSDLASLQTKAVKDGDDYIINGTKIWTSTAHHANRMFALVRTSTEDRPQKGITFVMLEMDTPGIEVEPIVNMAGEHEFNQVFFTDVRIPQSGRVGPEGQGWTVAKYLLEFERGSLTAGASLANALQKLKHFASEREFDDGPALIDDGGFRSRLNELQVTADAIAMTEKIVLSSLSANQNPGSAANVSKILSSETHQQVQEMAMEAAGYYGIPNHVLFEEFGANFGSIGPDFAHNATPAYLTGRMSTIAGGTGEVQRNILAKAELGL